jgi:hypothetical protein
VPSKTAKQARFFAACAHGADYASCPPAEVSHEFNQADKGSALLSRAMQHHAFGGPVSPLSAVVGNPGMMRSSLPHLGQSLGMAGRMRMPHIPLMDTMHNIDQHMSGARMKLPSLKAAMGGEIKSSRGVLSPQAINAIKDALSHLANRDASSAAATLRSSPDAMQHPVVKQAAHSLRASSGLAPTTKSLSNISNAAPLSAAVFK